MHSPAGVTRESDLSAYNRERFAGRVFDISESRIHKALELLAAEPKARALDVAAGSGYIAEAIAAQGWQMSAVEISTELAEQARRRGIVDVREHDLASGPLPFDDQTFGAVFAGEIVEHLVDTDRFLAEVARVLVPSGVLVLTTPNLASLENRLRLALGRYPRWLEYRLGGEGHVRLYTPRALRFHLDEHGFDTEKLRGNWVPLIPQDWGVHDVRFPALARTGDWFPGLAQGLICKARKR
jgi:SAM-dependent methyltransferase